MKRILEWYLWPRHREMHLMKPDTPTSLLIIKSFSKSCDCNYMSRANVLYAHFKHHNARWMCSLHIGDGGRVAWLNLNLHLPTYVWSVMIQITFMLDFMWNPNNLCKWTRVHNTRLWKWHVVFLGLPTLDQPQQTGKEGITQMNCRTNHFKVSLKVS